MPGLILPKPVPPKGTIGIVAPAGPENDLSHLTKMAAFFQSLGFGVKIAGSCYEKCADYLAGNSDAQRANDVMAMFADEGVDAILCMRGGYGSNRLIPYFEGFDFARHPKPFIGYSDITYLHIYFNQQHGLLTYHGPMVRELLKGNDLTVTSFLGALAGKNDFILHHIPFYGPKTKLATGTLVGGNLTMVCTTLGTNCEIDTAGKVLFLEEVDEPPYSVDRLLSHLYNAGKLQVAAGIILGDFNVEDRPATCLLLRKMLEPLGIPIAHSVDSGHCQPLLTLPLGSQACLNPSGGQIIFSGSGWNWWRIRGMI
ncbi:MAG: LD-carboxypeptidase [Turicibacter sp.]|nr:LD-carboxypeptidase [Turicibacter sp.]